MTLRELPQRWCVWKLAKRAGTDKFGKIPYQARNPRVKAKKNEPDNWASFEEATQVTGMDGVGLLTGQGITVIDLDDCTVAPYELSPEAQAFVESLDSWAEWSQSGCGVHIFLYAESASRNRIRFRGSITGEILGEGQYVAMTGKQVSGTPDDLAHGQQIIKDILSAHDQEKSKDEAQHHNTKNEQLSDDEVLKRANTAKNSDKFSRLWRNEIDDYESSSEADLALAGILAFWCGPGHEEQVERLMRRSELVRPKWDTPRKDSTYLRITIDEAYRGRADFYGQGLTADGAATVTDTQTWTEIGVGKLLAQTFGEDLIYIPGAGWFGWNGKWWVTDNGEHAESCVKQVIENLWKDVPGITDSTARGKAAQWLKSISTAAKVRGVVSMARVEKKIQLMQSPFDPDDSLLNTQNGIVNLRTGVLSPHDSRRYCSRITTVEYDPHAQCPRWETFLNEVTCGDEGLADFLHRAAGYSLTGSCREEAMFIHLGKGGNGKGTFCETLAKILGTGAHGYSAMASAEMFTMRKFGQPVEAARQAAEIAGARFVLGCESDQGVYLNEAALKRLTGNDTVNAREPYKKARDVRPTWKIHIQTNHYPTVSGMDSGLWRRIKCVQWSADFTGKNGDLMLKEKLLSKEARGILAWAIRGSVQWYRQGLKTPVSIESFTKNYRRENDLVGMWIDEECHTGTDVTDQSSELFRCFSTWLRGYGFRADDWNITRFGRSLTAKGFDSFKDSKGLKCRAGIITEIERRRREREAEIERRERERELLDSSDS